MMMKNILMTDDEPSDLDLVELMKEVAKDAKSKAVLEKRKLSELIVNQINTIKTLLNSEQA